MLQLFIQIFGETTVLLLVPSLAFLTVALVVYVALRMVNNRSAVRRRLTRSEGAPSAVEHKTGRSTAYRATASKVAKRVGPTDPREMKKLRAKLVQAGFYDPSAISWFFLSRILAAIGLTGVTAIAVWTLVPDLSRLNFWFCVGVGGAVGYLLPQFYLGNRVKRRIQSHRDGFPDFMDLLVICADAGLSMEASLARISQEIMETHPSLSDNLSIASAELRAGSPMSKALENLAARLAVPEANSFATLIQQSVELGSSITEALRVYSDDMRHRRLSTAEEKAYGLPAKLSVPLTLCILPVVMVVAMLPVIIRLMNM